MNDPKLGGISGFKHIRSYLTLTHYVVTKETFHI